ncbi:Ribosomal RNA small subunit methyltransferase G [Roseivivax jejudonensis]|uniref:Ribosomal RNA small subunit methyltransferase G n=1 Tax=Roseivivax jejudonensis TaxID=1529041 RepID=A0A1X6ZMP3_9RHOB|nr:16S rRNA (guanine(527)-N(7))-methyltransferase RsmG [Roseivivax jejudonensis]SLN56256.1 Ribosomal RNA small subunit methyltransferase G [Roseivivax jejudonensis]
MTVGGMAGVLPDVSRETTERLEHYANLVRKWSPKINLVSRTTLADLENRHIADSAQIFACAPTARRWADLGSGAGFPGLVCAILALERSPDTTFTLVESDLRKATFLRTVIRETGLTATVVSERAECTEPLAADVVSARALADLATLLSYAARHMASGGTALFPKGATWEKEVADAQAAWSFSMTRHKSGTHPDAVILQIGDVAHV